MSRGVLQLCQDGAVCLADPTASPSFVDFLEFLEARLEPHSSPAVFDPQP